MYPYQRLSPDRHAPRKYKEGVPSLSAPRRIVPPSHDPAHVYIHPPSSDASGEVTREMSRYANNLNGNPSRRSDVPAQPQDYLKFGPPDISPFQAIRQYNSDSPAPSDPVSPLLLASSNNRPFLARQSPRYNNEAIDYDGQTEPNSTFNHSLYTNHENRQSRPNAEFDSFGYYARQYTHWGHPEDTGQTTATFHGDSSRNSPHQLFNQSLPIAAIVNQRNSHTDSPSPQTGYEVRVAISRIDDRQTATSYFHPDTQIITTTSAPQPPSAPNQLSAVQCNKDIPTIGSPLVLPEHARNECIASSSMETTSSLGHTSPLPDTVQGRESVILSPISNDQHRVIPETQSTSEVVLMQEDSDCCAHLELINKEIMELDGYSEDEREAAAELKELDQKTEALRSQLKDIDARRQQTMVRLHEAKSDRKAAERLGQVTASTARTSKIASALAVNEHAVGTLTSTRADEIETDGPESGPEEIGAGPVLRSALVVKVKEELPTRTSKRKSGQTEIAKDVVTPASVSGRVKRRRGDAQVSKTDPVKKDWKVSPSKRKLSLPLSGDEILAHELQLKERRVSGRQRATFLPFGSEPQNDISPQEKKRPLDAKSTHGSRPNRDRKNSGMRSSANAQRHMAAGGEQETKLQLGDKVKKLIDANKDVQMVGLNMPLVVRPSIKEGANFTVLEAAKITMEVQDKPCIVLFMKSDEHLMCASCLHNGVCSFEGVRLLGSDAENHIRFITFTSDVDIQVEYMEIWRKCPEKPNAYGSRADAEYIMKHLYQPFSTLVEWEGHVEYEAIHNGDAHRPVYWKRINQDETPLVAPSDGSNNRLQTETDPLGVIELCDICQTTVFNGHWMCRRCGCLVCIDCRQTAAEYTDESVARERLLGKCTLTSKELSKLKQLKDRERREQPNTSGLRKAHLISDFLFIHRIDLDTLSTLKKEAEALFKEATKTCRPICPSICPPPTKDGTGYKLYYVATPPEEWSEMMPIFQEHWSRGEAIVVGNTNLRTRVAWTPEQFKKDIGEKEIVSMVDTRADTKIRLSLKKFWEGFTDANHRHCDEKGEPIPLKLKDWPTSTEFNNVLPNHFEDYKRILPFPDYTLPHGVYNLARTLPSAFNPPDLGPKMYNAYGLQANRKQGTTNLHLDISDAVNVMMFVGPPETDEANSSYDEEEEEGIDRDSDDERPIGASWHIWRPQDADILREFLKEELPGWELSEPFHDQTVYITKDLREKLLSQQGIRAWHIKQRLGDAVFIPAGAPHQVRNHVACIKVAEDFISPENIEQCIKLMQEFRNLSSSHANRQDKLQIKNVMYHAVNSCVSYIHREETQTILSTSNATSS